MLLKLEQEITTFVRVLACGVTPIVQAFSIVGRTPRCFTVCTERSRDNSLRFLSKFLPDIVVEHIDHDYLSTQVIQIPSKSKTNAKRGAKPITSLMTHSPFHKFCFDSFRQKTTTFQPSLQANHRVL